MIVSVLATVTLSLSSQSACVPLAPILYCEASTAELRAEQGDVLAGLVDVGRGPGTVGIVVYAYTSTALSPEDGQKLGTERADYVVDALLTGGVDPAKVRVVVVGAGERPAAGPASAMSDPVLSNYVEVRLTYAGSGGALVDGCGRVIEPSPEEAE
jgi:outer membrane protein OmpA-like peptidoglycan-associated protein